MRAQNGQRAGCVSFTSKGQPAGRKMRPGRLSVVRERLPEVLAAIGAVVARYWVVPPLGGLKRRLVHAGAGAATARRAFAALQPRTVDRRIAFVAGHEAAR